MKHLLTLILLAVAIAASGQVKLDSLVAGEIGIWNETYIDANKEGDRDTVAVYLLASLVPPENGFADTYVTSGYRVSVYKQYRSPPGTICLDCTGHWEVLQYLDRNKKPFPNTILIWDEKQKK